MRTDYPFLRKGMKVTHRHTGEEEEPLRGKVEKRSGHMIHFRTVDGKLWKSHYTNLVNEEDKEKLNKNTIYREDSVMKSIVEIIKAKRLKESKLDEISPEAKGRYMQKAIPQLIGGVSRLPHNKTDQARVMLGQGHSAHHVARTIDSHDPMVHKYKKELFKSKEDLGKETAGMKPGEAQEHVAKHMALIKKVKDMTAAGPVVTKRTQGTLMAAKTIAGGGKAKKPASAESLAGLASTAAARKAAGQKSRFTEQDDNYTLELIKEACKKVLSRRA